VGLKAASVFLEKKKQFHLKELFQFAAKLP